MGYNATIGKRKDMVSRVNDGHSKINSFEEVQDWSLLEGSSIGVGCIRLNGSVTRLLKMAKIIGNGSITSTHRVVIQKEIEIAKNYLQEIEKDIYQH